MTTMWPHLADVSFAQLRRLDTPVVLLLGRHDATTPPALAAAWLARLNAPSKAAIWFDDSAHLPMIEEPGRVFAALRSRVRPLAGADLPPDR